ncbi:MAG: glutathione S-transferase family protein [Acidiferrobacterales bacterium]
MINLYTMKSDSPNVRKVTIMLDEVGLPYKIRHVEKGDDGKFADEFLAINPNATVPAIVDEDTGSVVFESAAILYYLAEKTKQLLPPDLDGRGEVMKWLMFEAANIGPVMGELYYYMLYASDNLSESHLQRYKDKLARYCLVLDRQLSGQKYLCGQYSIADIAIYPWLVILEDIAGISPGDYSHLSKWAGEIGDRSAAKPDYNARSETFSDTRSASM